MSSAFTLLNNQLIKAGVKAQQGAVSGSGWMKVVSRAYNALKPAELEALKKAAAAAEKPLVKVAKAEANLLSVGTRSGLPIRVESMAEAMGLPIEKVGQMYPQIAPFRKPSTRLYTIAARLGIKPPTRDVIKARMTPLMKEKHEIKKRARAAHAQYLKRTAKDRTALDAILKRLHSSKAVKIRVARKVAGEKALGGAKKKVKSVAGKKTAAAKLKKTSKKAVSAKKATKTNIKK